MDKILIYNIIGIIGKICSGKSTIAKKLSQNYGIPILSFGQYLVEYSRLRGLSTRREDLQNLGESFIKEDHKAFLHSVINSQESIAPIIIIEGIRHKSILDELRNISCRSIFTFIDAPLDVRYHRYLNRLKEGDPKVSFEDFKVMDAHSVEKEIDELRNNCQLDLSFKITDEELFEEFRTIIARIHSAKSGLSYN